MNKNSNLRNALRKAFGEHTEPLREAQWERLKAVMDDEKPVKKRYLPWLLSIAAIVIVSVAIGFWFGKNTGTLSGTGQVKDEVSGKSQTKASDTNKNELLTASPGSESKRINDIIATNNLVAGDTVRMINSMVNKEKGVEQNAMVNSSGLIKEDRNKKGQIIPPGVVLKESAIKGNDNEGKKDIKKEGALSLENEPSKPVLSDTKVTLVKDNENVGQSEGKDTTITLVRNNEPLKDADSDTTLNSTGNKKIEKLTPPRKKFAFGLTTGISPVNIKVKSVSNNEKLHQDTRSLFDQSNEKSSSLYANLSFDWYVLENFNLSFNTGIQYRQISQDVNIEYKYNEIPFRDVDGSIMFYIHVPDSMDPDIFNVKGTNKLNFVNIPLKFGYTIPINPKNEFILTAGLNLSFLARANGQTFSINEVEFKPLSQSYKNKINGGLIGGLQFSHNLYKSWWLGLEGIWQQNNYKYNAEYGIIKSSINITNYNLCIKYKF